MILSDAEREEIKNLTINDELFRKQNQFLQQTTFEIYFKFKEIIAQKDKLIKTIAAPLQEEIDLLRKENIKLKIKLTKTKKQRDKKEIEEKEVFSIEIIEKAKTMLPKNTRLKHACCLIALHEGISYAEMGRMFDITGQTISLYCKKAARILRHTGNYKYYEKFMEEYKQMKC